MDLIDAGSSGRGWSWRESLLRCPQQFAYRHMLSFEEGSREPLIKGSLVHTGLAHANAELVAEQHGLTNTFLPWRDAIREQALREDQEIGYGDSWQKWGDLATETVGAYLAQRERPHVVAVETRINLWFDANGELVEPPTDANERLAMATDPRLALKGPPYLHTARIDVLEQDRYGRKILVDYKTCYRVDARKRDGFALSGQILGLTLWGSHTYGHGFGGTVLQMLRLTDGRERFPRITPSPAHYALASFGKSVVESEERLARLLTKDPMEWTRVFSEQGPCMDRYGPCSYREICMTGSKIRLNP